MVTRPHGRDRGAVAEINFPTANNGILPEIN
jgi:hypothetical protein